MFFFFFFNALSNKGESNYCGAIQNITSSSYHLGHDFNPNSPSPPFISLRSGFTVCCMNIDVIKSPEIGHDNEFEGILFKHYDF